jgi:hypothetical protein
MGALEAGTAARAAKPWRDDELLYVREGLWARLTREDFRALTPLFHGHINPYGQFALDLARPSFLEVA